MIDSAGWTTAITGKMRTTVNQVFDTLSQNTVLSGLRDNYLKKLQDEYNKDDPGKRIVSDMEIEANKVLGLMPGVVQGGVTEDGTVVESKVTTTGQGMDNHLKFGLNPTQEELDFDKYGDINDPNNALFYNPNAIKTPVITEGVFGPPAPAESDSDNG